MESTAMTQDVKNMSQHPFFFRNGADQSMLTAIRLPCCIKILIPSTMERNQIIRNEAYVRQTVHFFCRLFGGASVTRMIGWWVSDNELIEEPITKIESYCRMEEFTTHKPEIIDYALKLKSTLKQDAIALELNQEMMLI